MRLTRRVLAGRPAEGVAVAERGVLLRSRRRVLVATVIATVLLLALGFLAGRLVRSPQQQAADAAGPGLTVLTVPVQLRTLTAQVVIRGDISAGSQIALAAPSVSGTPTVTRVGVETGQAIKQGQVLVEVSGRPVFALEGKTPSYRDLRPGYSGDDVRQLQTDLKAMGFPPGTIDGKYGASTKTAVTKFYESVGYKPLPASDSDEQRVAAAADAVKQAQWAVSDAQDALNQALTAANGNNNDPQVVQARKTLSRAQDNLTAAKSQQSDVIASSGPVVPLGEYAFVPSFPSRIAEIEAVVGAPPSSPLLTVASGQLQAVGTVSAGQAALVQKGQSVDLLSEATGATAEGVVASVGQAASVQGGDAGGSAGTGTGDMQVVVEPTGTWDAGLWGANVRLTINGASTPGQVLVVPVSALFASADGTTKVTVRSADGTETDVTVTVGVHTGGYAAVEPVDGQLAAGDQVVVSADNSSAVQGP